MRKLSFLFVFICSVTFLSAQSPSPDEQIRMMYPRSDLYQSIVTVDNANGIFLNPAAGGFQNGVSFAFNGFIQKDNLAELQTAVVGIPFLNNIGYRRAFDKKSDNFYGSMMIGGSGSEKDFSFGYRLEYLSSSFGKNSDAWTINYGFISRPSRGFSFAYTIRNIGDVSIGDVMLRTTHDLGIGIRPLGNDQLTFTFDGQITSKQSLKDLGYKFGADVKIIPGIHLYGMWGKNEMLGKSMFAGLSIATPHFSFFGGGQKQDEANFENGSFGLLINELVKKSFTRSRHQIAEIRLKGTYNDFTTPGVEVFGFQLAPEERGVQSFVSEIDAIAKSDEVDALILHIESFNSTYNFFGMSAAIQEVGSALQRLRDKGKKLVVYLAPSDAMGSSIAELYLASYANTIYLSEYSRIYQYGIAYDAIKLRTALRKFLKIDMRTYTAGKFKSSLNQFSDTLSEHKVQELNSIIDVLYSQMLERLSTGRKINSQALSDTLSGILFPEDAVALGVADKIGWYDDAKKYTYQIVNGDTLPENKKVKTTSLYNHKTWNEEWGTGACIAVIGVYGGITSGESNAGGLPIPFLGGERTTGSETLVKQLKKAESDGDVKAIVLRVDSPGGYPVGSDEMYRALEKIKKPIVISMGDVATSGGYYVSSFGKKIFASPATMTASIGVISQIPFLNELADEYSIYSRPFNRGKYSGALDVMRPPTPEFEQGMKKSLDYVYQKFLSRIHRGRNISMDTLNEIAQGRIYTGVQAKQLRLIDELGGLYDAIEYLKKTNNLADDIGIEYYPLRTMGFSESFEEVKLLSIVKAWFSRLSEQPQIELR